MNDLRHGYQRELDADPVEERWTRIDRSVAYPGTYKASLMTALVRESVISYKDGLTWEEANRWCDRKLRGLNEPEPPYEPDVLMGNASLWTEGNEWEELRGDA